MGVERIGDKAQLRVCEPCLNGRTVRRAALRDEAQKAELIVEARTRRLAIWKLEHEIRSVQPPRQPYR